MLVLSRKCREEVRVGRDVVVKVLSIHGSRVTIGIDAPREITVHRAEVASHLLQEKSHD